MMKIKVVGLTVLFSLLSLSMTAQSIVWQLKPGNYSDIVRFGPDLYQVTKDGNIGIIHSDGSIVVPVECDEITGFYEHKALVLGSQTDAEGNKRILGYLTDKGQYVPFSATFYTLEGLAFYSDDMLPVNDAKGRRGYLDEKGIPVLGFKGKWSAIAPFTEGYAVVSFY